MIMFQVLGCVPLRWRGEHVADPLECMGLVHVRRRSSTYLMSVVILTWLYCYSLGIRCLVEVNYAVETMATSPLLKRIFSIFENWSPPFPLSLTFRYLASLNHKHDTLDGGTT